jgi:hypothetical protein
MRQKVSAEKVAMLCNRSAIVLQSFLESLSSGPIFAKTGASVPRVRELLMV